ncbi:MAG TPA: pyridoxal phosphate-dependent aminotransferase [Pyrinomonadaceae bacterium]|nr:pyridoxal phosphate-dependent aminotransferase [Pyrinomonadaceae bacterium]
MASIADSLFSELAARMATFRGESYPFHVGDTWLQPPAGCRLEDLAVREHPQMYRYPPSYGMADFLEVIAERMGRRTGLEISTGNILVSAGATGAVASIIGAVMSPREEVIVLAPYWPLITGIIKSFSGVPVTVPFYGRADSPESALEIVSAGRTSRTVGLYLNTPNNPTGRVVPRSWLEPLIEWARGQGLWVLSDEVYEDYAYEGAHVYCHALAPQTVFSVHSFAKAFGMAGNRCGFAVGPAEAIKYARKVNTHMSYGAPAAAQIAGRRTLLGPGDRWAEEARAQYLEIGRSVAARLGVDPPEGGNYLFMDLSEVLGGADLSGFLDGCVTQGLLLAPGTMFGDYPRHARMCFTSAPPEVTFRGVELLAKILGR